MCKIGGFISEDPVYNASHASVVEYSACNMCVSLDVPPVVAICRAIYRDANARANANERTHARTNANARANERTHERTHERTNANATPL